jgi:hypothetical protein
VPQRKKRNFVKESNIKSLTEDDLENIVDYVKEVTDDMFKRVA